eukprot:6083666-Alexandrium_andersonii.AAC.1
MCIRDSLKQEPRDLWGERERERERLEASGTIARCCRSPRSLAFVFIVWGGVLPTEAQRSATRNCFDTRLRDSPPLQQ